MNKNLLVTLVLFAAGASGCVFNVNSSSSVSENSSSTSVSSLFDSSSEIASSSATSISSSESSSSAASTSEDDTMALVSSQDYYDFFNPTTVLQFTLTAPYTSLKGLQDAYESPIEADNDNYFRANLVIDMTPDGGALKEYTLNDVGIRMKGNTSRRSFMDDNGSLSALIHYKISFTEFVSKRTFLGMTKIDIKWNKNLDGTQIRQTNAYKMFAAMDVLSPQTTLAPLTMNITGLPGGGSSTNKLGLYEVIECIDKVFIQRRFNLADAGGNLYKCGWGAPLNSGDWSGASLSTWNSININGTTYTRKENGLIGIEDLEIGYHPAYDLKTNDSAPDYSDIANLIGFLSSTTSYSNASKLAQLAALVDIPSFLRLEAVAYLLGNPDDCRNNYNNYYLYFAKTTHLAYFIPYDWDRCLGVTKDWDPSGNGMVDINPFANTIAANGNVTVNPLYKFTVINGGSAAYQRQFADNIRAYMASDWFSLAPFTAMYTIYHDHYADDVATFPTDLPFADWTLGNDAGENITTSNYLSSKKTSTNNYLNAKFPL
ncbi:MAG: CotH kinase family protein [Firmicutes bacterium]|nr:CotH kinase family protein [Bacillota bacterium]